MSELKAHNINDVSLHDIANCAFYFKSEADKVIMELKEKHKTEVKELLCLIRDKENNFNRAFDSEEKEIRHQKYKRCLAMSKVCYLRFVRYENYLRKLCASNATIAAYKFRMGMYDKWEKRWFKLAKKFKDKEA